MVYIITVERIIKVTSDAINKERNRLIALAKSLEKSALKDFSINTSLFLDLLIAPHLPSSILGYFHEKYRIIVLSEDLIDLDISARDNILKHELAHALEFALSGTTTGHSKQFKSLTAYFGTDKEFEKAKIEKTIIEKSKMKSKVEKLLALSTSPFENEAMQALSKAQMLMIENHIDMKDKETEEKLFFAMTLHNIPEGMAVGVVFAGVINGNSMLTLSGALALSIGMAIQNIPEGAIISVPLRNEGKSRATAFTWGALSGLVEPIAAVVTILFLGENASSMPTLLAFAAGAMLYVVVEELIPSSQAGKHSNVGTIGFAIGFVLMMTLDVILG